MAELALGFDGCAGRQSASAQCLQLRGGGGSKELRIEHRAFVANLPRTLTDKGLREVCKADAIL